MSSPGGLNASLKPQRSPRYKGRKWVLLAGSLVALLLLWTCGRSAYHAYKTEASAMERFHRQLDNAEYEDIYGDATDEFRSAGTREQQIALFKTIHEKMGNSGKCSVKGFHINASTKGTFVNAVYTTVFAAGSANEYFVWRMDTDQPRLWSYHMDSPSLR
jgi:hypothetical protein